MKCEWTLAMNSWLQKNTACTHFSASIESASYRVMYTTQKIISIVRSNPEGTQKRSLRQTSTVANIRTPEMRELMPWRKVWVSLICLLHNQGRNPRATCPLRFLDHRRVNYFDSQLIYIALADTQVKGIYGQPQPAKILSSHGKT